MTATKTGIVYSTINKHIRRIITPDDDRQIGIVSSLVAGESLLVVDRSEMINADSPRYLLKQKLGYDAGNPRCVVTDKFGVVVSVVLADPLVDTPPENHILILDPDGKLSAVFDAEQMSTAAQADASVDII